MFRFLVRGRTCVVRHGTCNGRPRELLPLQTFQSLLVSHESTLSAVNDRSSTVSYLVNSCGFSSESALSASKYLHFDGPTKPDSVIAMFKTYGFSQSQISRIVARNPIILAFRPETLLPKIQFFGSKGVSIPDLAIVLAKNPLILTRSLKNHVIPFYNLIRDIVLSDEKAIGILKRCIDVIGRDFKSYLVPNINFLVDIGVSKSSIAMAFCHFHRQFIARPDRFKAIIEQLKELGLSPTQYNFVIAFIVLSGLGETTLERKMDVYKSWGWTEDEVAAAFRSCPWCLAKSEGKIAVIMDILVNKMGWRPSQIAKFSQVLTMSLENRIIPKVCVIQFLLSKGLLKKVPAVSTIFQCSGKEFLQKYVNCYEEGPQLLKLYREKLDLAVKPDEIHTSKLVMRKRKGCGLEQS